MTTIIEAINAIPEADPLAAKSISQAFPQMIIDPAAIERNAALVATPEGAARASAQIASYLNTPQVQANISNTLAYMGKVAETSEGSALIRTGLNGLLFAQPAEAEARATSLVARMATAKMSAATKFEEDLDRAVKYAKNHHDDDDDHHKSSASNNVNVIDTAVAVMLAQATAVGNQITALTNQIQAATNQITAINADITTGQNLQTSWPSTQVLPPANYNTNVQNFLNQASTDIGSSLQSYYAGLIDPNPVTRNATWDTLLGSTGPLQSKISQLSSQNTATQLQVQFLVAQRNAALTASTTMLAAQLTLDQSIVANL